MALLKSVINSSFPAVQLEDAVYLFTPRCRGCADSLLLLQLGLGEVQLYSLNHRFTTSRFQLLLVKLLLSVSMGLRIVFPAQRQLLHSFKKCLSCSTTSFLYKKVSLDGL